MAKTPRNWQLSQKDIPREGPSESRPQYGRRTAFAIERARRTPEQELKALVRQMHRLPEHATRLREQYRARIEKLTPLVYFDVNRRVTLGD
jgi:hypothetical protein